MPVQDSAAGSSALEADNRRRHIRVPGPFNGRRRGVLPVPLHIHDLSVGGCLVQSFHENPIGRRMTIEIELPYEGWLAVQAEVRYSRADYGFAVEFVEVPPETRGKLEWVIQRMLAKEAGEE